MPRTTTRKVVVNDNLDYLSQMPEQSVRLAYMDPPFCSGRDYESVSARRWSPHHRASRRSFSDRWTWDAKAEGGFNKASRHLPHRLTSLLTALTETTADYEMAAYLFEITPRLAEIHRVLTKDGSLYVHCDSSASHYLKVVLDAIFGRQRFLNDIVWRRTHAHSSSRRFGPVHDTILFYTKGDRHFWSQQFTAYARDYIDRYYTKEDIGDYIRE